MTAEPPSPSWGHRVVQEWLEERGICRGAGHTTDADATDLARRIDAALAERARERDEARAEKTKWLAWYATRTTATKDALFEAQVAVAALQNEVRDLRAALAEREA